MFIPFTIWPGLIPDIEGGIPLLHIQYGLGLIPDIEGGIPLLHIRYGLGLIPDIEGGDTIITYPIWPRFDP